ncbi:putative tRNA guanosine-2'-O-methyltransferase TRM11 [Cryptosporidium serpentis]
MPLYLAWFTLHHDYYEFRFDELESLAIIYGVDKHELWSEVSKNTSFEDNKKIIRSEITDNRNPFVWVKLPNDNIALQILGRSILIRGFIEVWSSGSNYNSVKNNLEFPEIKNNYINKYLNESLEFSWYVRAIGKKLSRQEQVDRMNFFRFLFTGKEKVNLKNPSIVLVIFEEWKNMKTYKDDFFEINDNCNKLENFQEITQRKNCELRRVYMGRAVGIQNWHDIGKKTLWWFKYTLNERPILGPTTLDNELSFIMCNIGKVKENSIIFDPFCGTGGTLIAASHLGALCFGSDLDIRVLNGWSCSYVNPHLIKNGILDKLFSRNIFSNFIYYKLPLPEIIRMDVSSSALRYPFIDAIICDPPYGIRASSRTTKFEIMDECFNDTTNFSMSKGFGYIHSVKNIIYDMLIFASKYLVNNGRIVFLLPVILNEICTSIDKLYKDWSNIYNIEYHHLQTLGGGLGRLLVCMTIKSKNYVQSISK